MFAAEFEPVQINGRRRSPRASVSFDVQVRNSCLTRTLCKVVDVSVYGARLQTYSAIRKGSTIWLILPEAGPVAADVIWSDDYNAGCQFRTRIDPATFERLLATQR